MLASSSTIALGKVGSSSSRALISSYSALDQCRQRILASHNKPLPLWAQSFSYRRRFLQGSARQDKNKDDSILRSMDVTIQGDADNVGGPVDQRLDILFEWRALQNRLQKAGPKSHSNTYHQSDDVTASAPVSTFFDSYEPVLRKEMVHSPALTHRAVKVAKAAQAYNHPLWITTIETELLRKAIHECMMQIRAGQRNVQVLAAAFLRRTGAVVRNGREQEILMEQSRVFILSQWVARASQAVLGGDIKSGLLGMCLQITNDLYLSMPVREGKSFPCTSLGGHKLLSIKQVTLFKLFSFLYPLARRRKAQNESTTLHALRLLTILLRDSTLRPAQLRYMCRKLCDCLRTAMVSAIDRGQNELLWREAVESFTTLVEADVLTPTPDANSTSETVIDSLLHMLSVARNQQQISREVAHDTIIKLASAAQSAGTRRMLASNSASSSHVSKRIEDVFDVAPFVLQTTFEEMCRCLHECGDYLTLKELAFMAPQQQRTLPVLSLLMRKWSKVLPDLAELRSPLSARERRKEASILGYRKCSTSQQIWKEAELLLEREDDILRMEQLRIVFNARMASHARARASTLVVADFKTIRSLRIGDKKQIPYLWLNERACIDAVRAFLRAGFLEEAVRLAKNIIKATTESSAPSSDRASMVPVTLLNILLIAQPILRADVRIIANRRRFSAMIRQGTSIKTHRRYLRTSVNRYLRATKAQSCMQRVFLGREKHLRYRQTIQFLTRISQQLGIMPNEQTKKILIGMLLRLRTRNLSDGIIRRIRNEFHWDWESKGVAGVMNDIDAFIATESHFTSTNSTAGSQASASLPSPLPSAALSRRQRNRQRKISP